MTCRLLVFCCLMSSPAIVFAQDRRAIDEAQPGGRMLKQYLEKHVTAISDRHREISKTFAEHRADYREQLFEMLSLSPRPEKTPLEPVITKTEQQDDVVVECLHFQSRPGLYVTGNLYRPAKQTGKLPAILYVCGHGRTKIDGVSYGNKVNYQHHGAWFARHGYVCLTIDTLQLGEIEGIHHGTYNHDMWWWIARGYTSAGVEAWNSIRALDYLETRSEVDPERLGVTGRSGGGASSWWIAALDERIKAAVPVAGITSLTNHVIDGCVEGHCDCMYPINTHRHDFAMVAGLVAPRPLLISNTDKDGIFPLSGVIEVYGRTRQIYKQAGQSDHLGLQIAEGPHKDTQQLRVDAFHWFNRFLKREDPLIDSPAVAMFEPKQLKVFETLPNDELNTTIQDSFVPTAKIDPPTNEGEWKKLQAELIDSLKQKSFQAWPDIPPVKNEQLEFVFDEVQRGVRLQAWDVMTDDPFRLRLYVASPAGRPQTQLDSMVLNVLDEDGWQEFVSTMNTAFAQQLRDTGIQTRDSDSFEKLRGMLDIGWGRAWFAPRGIGLTRWSDDQRKLTQIRRRFPLLGMTRDSGRVFDTRRMIQAIRAVDGLQERPLWLHATGPMAGVALYASLFEPAVARLDLYKLPVSHHDGPILLNVMRFMDMPQAVAMAAKRSKVQLYTDDASAWRWVTKTLRPREMVNFRIRKPPISAK